MLFILLITLFSIVILACTMIRIATWVTKTKDEDIPVYIGIFSTILLLVCIVIPIAINIDKESDIAEIEAFYKANYENYKITGRIDLEAINQYNTDFTRLKRYNNNIWIGICYPNVPGDLELIIIDE